MIGVHVPVWHKPYASGPAAARGAAEAARVRAARDFKFISMLREEIGGRGDALYT